MTDTSDPDAAAPPDDTGDDDADQGTVLLTVMKNSDGTYTLIDGDEDQDDGDEGDAMGAGAAAPGVGAPGAGAESGGQTFDSIGALLKGILDLVKADSEQDEGGSGADNFAAGFAGGASASPPKPTMAQKY